VLTPEKANNLNSDQHHRLL